MSWLMTLCETYDNCSSLVGKMDESGDYLKMLLPISHLTAQAQIEIVINEHGEFIRAQKISKGMNTTLIQITEESASRSSNVCPMPLCDKLCYIAGDYDYEIRSKKSMAEYYQTYMENLRKWVESEYVHANVKAIYQYLIKGTVVYDLKSVGVFDKEDDFVRFLIKDQTSGVEKGIWEDENIQKCFQDYYLSTLCKKGICYVTGKEEYITGKLPARIRNSGDMAKLISSNDKKSNKYTYKGRFEIPDEAATIGYEAAQKAHNTLRWLIAKQGKRYGSESIVCWSTGGKKTLSLFENSFDVFGWDEDIEQLPDTSERFAKKIYMGIEGYKVNLDINNKIVIMAVDTADGLWKGRLAITYYAELSESEYLNNIKNWHIDCMWEHLRKDKDSGEEFRVICAPSVEEIILAAYGTEQKKKLQVDDKLKKKEVERILPCIAQRKKFPKDVMRAVVRNAGEPQRYSKDNAETILRIACSLVHKCQVDENRKEVYEMSLRKESDDRDYLFGRLLAVFDVMECVVNKTNNNERNTNAVKYWNAYTRKPAKTAVVIRNNLNSYIEKMKISQQEFYSKQLEEILEKLENVNGFNNEPLKENYLLGYYSQRAELHKSSKKSNENIKSTENVENTEIANSIENSRNVEGN